MMACTFNSKEHMIIDPPLMDWVRRHIPDKEHWKFFCYFHRRWGTFVIARWISKQLGLFTDFMNLAHSLGNFDHDAAGVFLQRFYKPLTANHIAKVVDQTSKDFVSARMDEQERAKEAKVKSREFWRKHPL